MYFVSTSLFIDNINILGWLSARTSAKLPITFACFAVHKFLMNVEEIRS